MTQLEEHLHALAQGRVVRKPLGKLAFWVDTNCLVGDIQIPAGCVKALPPTRFTPGDCVDYTITNHGRSVIGLPRILTPDEFAQETGYHPESIRRLWRSGEICGAKVGGEIFISETKTPLVLLGTAEVAEQLGVPVWQVQEWAQKRIFIGTLMGNRRGKGTMVYEPFQVEEIRPYAEGRTR